MENIEDKEILKILEIKSQDSRLRQSSSDTSKFKDEKFKGNVRTVNDYIESKISDKSVVGLDIYKYSEFESVKQALIPILFKYLYKLTSHFCIMRNQYIFQNYKDVDEMKKDFIDTGDGGFQIFDNPLQSIIFAIGFASYLRAYNSYKYIPELREIIGEISLRYALTYDTCYLFNQNHYGSSIINNARIMGVDKLDRCILDEGTYEWFMKHLNGIENLQFINLGHLATLPDFENYDKKDLKNSKSIVFPIDDKKDNNLDKKIYAVDVQKIGNIKSKETNLSIYNLHLQIYLRDKENSDLGFAISLGNLNTTGID